MDKIVIDRLLNDSLLRSIIESPDFYFQKGKEVLQKWLDMPVSDNLKNDLLNLSKDYDKLQNVAKANPEINSILQLLFEIIAYCDTKAKDKNNYNKYNDKRCLAMAYVRMNNWIEHLVLFRLNPVALSNGSTKNAFNYLLDPENNATILSENHRELISKNLIKKEFSSVDFVNDLKSFFDEYNISTKNIKNYTHLLSRIIYSIEGEWKEEVVALMASDGTGWQDEHIEELENHDACIVWNSKRPSGTAESLKFLKRIVDEGNSFNLYYCSAGNVNYKATIIDFVENQQQLDKKKWNSKGKNIMYYQPNFADYASDNKKASIVFLADKLEKIPPIPVSKFKFYKAYDIPRQDNLSPVKYEPETGSNTDEINPSKKINNTGIMDKFLNQILFGPPGTGKTYNTINKALEIIGEAVKDKTRREIKDLFDAKLKDGQIVFTTFHQGMSYEDFIEGIKPIVPKQEGQPVIYKIVDGIFKKACAIAAYNSYRLFIKLKIQPDKYSYDDLYKAFIESIQDKIDNNIPPVYKTLRGRDVQVKEININNSIIARAKNSIANNSAPLTKENMQKLYDRFKAIEEIEDLKQIKETVQVTSRITEFYAVFSGLKQFEKTFKPDEQLMIETKEIETLDFDEIQNKFNAGVYTEAIKQFGNQAEPVVMIIDEINRGNVSQIFGELITLIEEDKRLGKEEALEATLPYSKEKFGVPPNLYIIGTMNTADRSVESLDAALRRRFNFEEILPNPILITTEGTLKTEKGFLGTTELPLVLNTINKRIEKLLDKDHQIGHSYFMTISKLTELKIAFKNKIIPLLQEYFFGDYGKIGLVMGKGFFEPVENLHENIFADFDEYDASDFSERRIYKIRDIANMPEEDFIKAINTLLKK